MLDRELSARMDPETSTITFAWPSERSTSDLQRLNAAQSRRVHRSRLIGYEPKRRSAGTPLVERGDDEALVDAGLVHVAEVPEQREMAQLPLFEEPREGSACRAAGQVGLPRVRDHQRPSTIFEIRSSVRFGWVRKTASRSVMDLPSPCTPELVLVELHQRLGDALRDACGMRLGAGPQPVDREDSASSSARWMTPTTSPRASRRPVEPPAAQWQNSTAANRGAWRMFMSERARSMITAAPTGFLAAAITAFLSR